MYAKCVYFSLDFYCCKLYINKLDELRGNRIHAGLDSYINVR